MKYLAEYGDEWDIDTEEIREARRAYRAALVAWRVGKIPEEQFWPVYDHLKALVDENADVHAGSHEEAQVEKSHVSEVYARSPVVELR
jgi:hypothetical protein